MNSVSHRLRRGLGFAAMALALTAVEDATAQFPPEPPLPGQIRPLQIPPFDKVTEANGLEMVLVENHELPIVSISLTMPAGSSYDPVGKEGLAGLTSEVLLRGTESRTAEEIAAEIEGVGASLNSGAGPDFFTLSTTVLKEHVELAFTLISDVLLNATFPQEEVDLALRRMFSSLQAQEGQPDFLVNKFFRAAVYGDHPYGRTATSTSVGTITRDDIVNLHAARLRPGGSLLVLAGDITLDEARNLVRDGLGEWVGSAPARGEFDVADPQPTEILLVNRPGSAQSNILVGNLTMRPGDPDYYAAVIANRVLGGGFDARLFMILREEKGWTYGAYSSHTRPQGVGRFQINTEVRTEVTDSALSEIMYQAQRMRTERLPDIELDAAKGYLVGRFPRLIETPQQVAEQVRIVRLLGLGDDYMSAYRDRLGAISSLDIIDVAQRLVLVDSAAIVVVGDGPSIYEKLAAIAPVRIVDTDGNPLTPADLDPDIAPLEVDPSRVVARRDSFQITLQGNPIGTQVTELSSAGDSLIYHETTSVPMAGLNQTTTLVLGSASLDIRSLDQTMQMGPFTPQSHLVFDLERGAVVGRVESPDQQTGAVTGVDIDRPIREGLLISDALRIVVPTLSLSEGASFKVRLIDTTDGGVKIVSITVAGTEEVTVPAGTYQAYRVELTGLEGGVVFYLSGDDHRLVKVEPIGQPIVFELVR
jgi:zinc protease